MANWRYIESSTELWFLIYEQVRFRIRIRTTGRLRYSHFCDKHHRQKNLSIFLAFFSQMKSTTKFRFSFDTYQKKMPLYWLWRPKGWLVFRDRFPDYLFMTGCGYQLIKVGECWGGSVTVYLWECVHPNRLALKCIKFKVQIRHVSWPFLICWGSPQRHAKILLSSYVRIIFV